jgi:hypothetical protein
MSQALLQQILDYEDRPTKQRLDLFFQSEPRELGTPFNKEAPKGSRCAKPEC